MKTILILEDNDDRLAGFQKALASLGEGLELKVWRDAHLMAAECADYFPTAGSITIQEVFPCLHHGKVTRPQQDGGWRADLDGLQAASSP